MNGQILVILVIVVAGAGSFLIYEHYQPNDNNALSVEGANTENNITAAALSNQLKEGAPVQNAIKQAVSNGTLSEKDMDGPPEYASQILENNKTNIKIQYTTKLKFKNPKGAGIDSDKWPKFQMTNPNNTKEVIDYDQNVKDAISSEIQNITDPTAKAEINKAWNNYSFDSGERIYEVNETYDGTYVNNSNATFKNGLPVDDPPGTYYYSILMGFTEGVYWRYHKEDNLDIPILWWKTRIAWYRADIFLDSAIGLRLPTRVGLNVPNQMINGKSYTLSTDIIGEDWNADQYRAANVPPENGNEYVTRLRFSMDLRAWTIVTGDIGPYTNYKDLDYSRSFKTPFGPNEKFPLPVLEYSPDQTNLKVYPLNGLIWLGIGLKIEPILGSDKITTTWNAGGASNGNGLIEYKLPGNNYEFGPVKVENYNDDNKNAIIKLSDYNYYLNICKVDLDANVQGGLTFMPLKVQTPYLTIYSYNCAGLTNEIHLGIHRGTNANNVTANIPVLAGFVPLSNASNTTENVNAVSSVYSANAANTVENINATVSNPIITSIASDTSIPTETNWSSTPLPIANWTENPTETPTPTEIEANWTETPTPTEMEANWTENPTEIPTETPTPLPTETITEIGNMASAGG